MVRTVLTAGCILDVEVDLNHFVHRIGQVMVDPFGSKQDEKAMGNGRSVMHFGKEMAEI